MARSIPYHTIRYGIALLGVAPTRMALQIPSLGDEPEGQAVQSCLAVLVGVWYGGLGPGLLVMAVDFSFFSDSLIDSRPHSSKLDVSADRKSMPGGNGPDGCVRCQEADASRPTHLDYRRRNDHGLGRPDRRQVAGIRLN
jgi:hypothetical protein